MLEHRNNAFLQRKVLGFLTFLYDSRAEFFLIELYIKLDFLQILRDLADRFVRNQVVVAGPKDRDLFVFFKDNLTLLRRVRTSSSDFRVLGNYLGRFETFRLLTDLAKKLNK